MKPFVRLCAVLAVLAPSASRSAAQPLTPRVPPTGTHAFRLILHGSKLRPLQQLDDLAEKPNQTLLIVFGAAGGLTPAELRSFRQRGGAILVATDRADAAEDLRQVFGVVPTGLLVQNPNPKLNYRGEKSCPFVTVFPQTNHPLFRGVQRLATNAPTLLAGGTGLTVLARFPDSCIASAPPGQEAHGRLGRLHWNNAFAVGNNDSRGKQLLLGGHGVFMNGMVATRDNWTFAHNCIDWFTRNDRGTVQRDRVLFIEEGRIVRKFEVPLVESPNPPLPTAAMVEDLMLKLEQENFYNRLLLAVERWLVDLLGPSASQVIFRLTLILLTLLLVLYGVRRLWRARHHLETKVPLVVNNVAENVSRDALVAQRHRLMLQQGNLWEAARELARQCFTEYAGRTAGQPPARPDIAVHGSWWGRRTLHRQVERLWKLAYESPARPISRTRFQRLAAEAEAVKAALASGALTLHEPVAGPAILHRSYGPG